MMMMMLKKDLKRLKDKVCAFVTINLHSHSIE